MADGGERSSSSHANASKPASPSGTSDARQDLLGGVGELQLGVDEEDLVLDADLHRPSSAAAAAIRPITSAPARPLQ